MNFTDLVPTIAFPAVILLVFTSLTIFISADWRLSLLALSLQYLGVFALVIQYWSFEMAATKLIAGWISAAVLGIAILNLPTGKTISSSEEPQIRTLRRRQLGLGQSAGRLVFVLASVLVWLVVLTYAPFLTNWVPELNLYLAWGCTLLIGMGLLQLGFTSRPFLTALGLLTILAGFEILYAAVETSALVAGLLTVVNLGISMVGAYLLLSPHMERSE
jgi:hypothetical protein